MGELMITRRGGVNTGSVTDLYMLGKFGDIGHSYYRNPSSCSASENSRNITLKTVTDKTCEVYVSFGVVDLTGIDTIYLNGTFSDTINGTHYAVLYVATEPSVGRANAVASVQTSVSTPQSAGCQLDVSALTGEYHIYAGQRAGAWGNARTYQIERIYMK